jgi:hypothetical protein
MAKIGRLQGKILQESDIAYNRDMNPFPHGGTAADLAKMFEQIFCEKRAFADYNSEK